MQIRTPLELGLTIRDRRRKLGLTQAELASKIGAGRQWLMAFERGKSRAEVGLVLRALAALDLSLTIHPDDLPREPDNGPIPVDINAVVDAAKKARE